VATDRYVPPICLDKPSFFEILALDIERRGSRRDPSSVGMAPVIWVLLRPAQMISGYTQ
jgi:hypothetical protein